MFEYEIDLEFIKKDANYCEGYARSLISEVNQVPKTIKEIDDCAVAATYFKRAAEHRFLYCTSDCSKRSLEETYALIAAAAEQYHKLGSQYALLLDFLIDSSNVLDKSKIYNVERNTNYNKEKAYSDIQDIQYVYSLLVGRKYYNKNISIKDLLMPWQTQRIGVIGIPINQLINAVEAISGNNTEDSFNSSISTEGNVILAMQPIFQIYDEALQIASLNKYNFKRLLMSFHPVNIELIVLLLQVHYKSDINVFEVLERSIISYKTKIFLSKLISIFINGEKKLL